MNELDDRTDGDCGHQGDQSDRTAGWSGDFPTFISTPAALIRRCLGQFSEDAPSGSQTRAWTDSIPLLQGEAAQVIKLDVRGDTYSAILEYRLPLEARRADAVFLVAGTVIVIELKGKSAPSLADLDQAGAYARDLRAYHRECHDRPVHAVLVPTLAKSQPHESEGVWVTGPESLDQLVFDLSKSTREAAPSAEQFLTGDAYRPLPTLIQAARELFFSGEVREIWKARAATEPAVRTIAEIARHAAATRTRHLVLVTGVPGSGKTLVGMRAVHAHHLDDMAIPRAHGKPTSPGLFLSGNGPLVEVLQHVLRGAGGGGRAFVRHIKDYLDSYVPRPDKIPPEHLLVFDEAQRAFTSDKVRDLHKKWPSGLARSEPQHFVDLCERMPEWSVLVGLIGSGQEIHLGEEGGLQQWRQALEASREPDRWSVHAPAEIESVFLGSSFTTKWEMSLNLDTSLRFHLVPRVHRFVSQLLEETGELADPEVISERSAGQEAYDLSGIRMWATRDLALAKQYLWDRYREQPDARFGVLASSRDKLLAEYGIKNDYQSTKNVRLGAWYSENEQGTHSCRRLESCVTEFGAQGLELDMALLAWGSDFIRADGKWDDSKARKYKGNGIRPVNPFQLRTNAYRVLLTRGRDGTVVFVPPARDLDETWAFLIARGFRELT